MDELWCPHFWSQVVWPMVYSLIPFINTWFRAGVAMCRRMWIIMGR